MPSICFEGFTVTCEVGANLREALLTAGTSPYNGPSKLLNCRGHGTCGTCAVRVEGKISTPTRIEKIRLALPPHVIGAGLRLACQCRVLGDVTIEKCEGLWGQQVGKRR